MASKLIAFYRGAPDESGRRLEEMLDWPEHVLEYTHDYIQWMFPLRERSAAQPFAPVLSDDDVKEFRRDPALRQRMIEALTVMRAFYRIDGDGPRDWIEFGNHNYLRLTRILRSLRTVGLESEARDLFDELTEIYRENQDRIGATTYRYWQQAMTDDL